MDYINILPEILPKMRTQMHGNKGIHSLSEINFYISKFDLEKSGLCQVYKFENFLASIGVFLKTQERSELMKFLQSEYPNFISFRKFLDIFKLDREDIKDLVDKASEIYNKILNPQGILTYHDFLNKIWVQNHPLMKMFGETEDVAWNRIEYDVNFVIGNKEQLSFEDFVAIQLNIFYLLPEDRVPYFIKCLPDIYGC